MGENRRGYPLQDKTATDVQARYPNGKEGYYQVWKDYRPYLTKEFGKITPTLLNIVQVARDKAALGVGRETVAKEDGRMDKDMLGGWGRHTNQVCWRFLTMLSYLFQVYFQPVLLGALSFLFASVGVSVLGLAIYRLTLEQTALNMFPICKYFCFTGLWMQKDQNLRSLSKSSWTGFRWFWILPGPLKK